MSVRLSNLRRLWSRAAFAMGVAVWFVQAFAGSPQPGQSIEFSDPKSDTLVTNANQLSGRTRSTQLFEVDFSAPGSMGPIAGSLMGALPSPSRSGGVIVNKRDKDLFDPGNDILSRTPEETMRELLVKDLLKLPDYGTGGQNRQMMQQSTPSERLYEEMVTGHARTASAPQYNDSFGSRKAVDRGNNRSELEESRSPLGELDNASSKSWLGSDLNSRLSTSSRPNSLSDLLGLSNSRSEDDEMSPEKKREREALDTQLENYRTILSYPASPLEGLGSVKTSSRPNPWSSASPTLSSPLDQHGLFAPQQGIGVTPALLPPTAPIAPMPSSLSPVPYVPPPARAPAPKPVFSVPQRTF